MANNSVQINFDLSQIDKSLATLPHRLHYKVIDEGLKAAAKIIRDRARELAPRSERTGSVKKLSKKAVAANKQPKQPLHKSLVFYIRKYDRGSIVHIGAAWPIGNHINFNFGKGRNRFFWGKRVDFKIYENFLKKAADETEPQWKSAFEQTVKQKSAELS